MNYSRLARTYPRLIAFGFTLTLFSSFGQTFFIAVFGPEIRAEFGLTHGSFGAVYSGATLASSLCLIWLGATIDRFPLRLYAQGVAFGLIGGAVIFSFASNLLLLPLGIFFLRLFGQGLMGHTAMTTMARFFDSSRGKALSIAALGFPLGEAVLPRAFVEIKALVGWRPSWWIVGAVVMFVLLPFLHWVFSREVVGESGGVSGAKEATPSERNRRTEAASAARFMQEKTPAAKEDLELAPPRPDPVQHGWTRGQVVRDVRFYLVLPSILAPPFIATGLFFHQVALAEAKGWSVELFTSTFVAYATLQTLMSLGVGPLVDRFRASLVLIAYLVPMGLGLVLLALTGAPTSAFIFMGLCGVSAGAQSTVVGAYWVEAYGPAHLGAIRSLALSMMVFATAAAPILLGRLIDLGFSFERISWFCVVFVAVAIFMAGFAWKEPAPGAAPTVQPGR